MKSRFIRDSEIITDDAAACLEPTPGDGRRPLFDTNSLPACDDLEFSPEHIARQMKIFGPK